MRTIHIVENLGDTYGGPARSIPELCRSLRDLGVDSILVSVAVSPAERNTMIERCALDWRSVPALGPARLRYSLRLRALITAAVRESGAELLHLHSLWTYPSYAAFSVARTTGLPLMCSVRSNLYPASLRRSSLRKAVARRLFVDRMLDGAACTHATEPNEVAAIRRFGLNGPVALITNGVNTEEFTGMATREQARQALGLVPDRRYALFLSRVHPRKNLDLLVDAWAALAARHEDWDLLVAGPNEDPAYLATIVIGAERAGLAGRLHVLGMLTGEDRLHAYAAADLFVLPSRFENFGMAIGEALAAGRPVIVSQGTPWADVLEAGAGWWVEASAPALASALQEAFEMPDDALRAMGARGPDLIATSYAWSAQAEKMKAVYLWLTGRGARPDCVDVAPANAGR